MPFKRDVRKTWQTLDREKEKEKKNRKKTILFQNIMSSSIWKLSDSVKKQIAKNEQSDIYSIFIRMKQHRKSARRNKPRENKYTSTTAYSTDVGVDDEDQHKNKNEIYIKNWLVIWRHCTDSMYTSCCSKTMQRLDARRDLYWYTFHFFFIFFALHIICVRFRPYTVFVSFFIYSQYKRKSLRVYFEECVLLFERVLLIAQSTFHASNTIVICVHFHKCLNLKQRYKKEWEWEMSHVSFSSYNSWNLIERQCFHRSDASLKIFRSNSASDFSRQNNASLSFFYFKFCHIPSIRRNKSKIIIFVLNMPTMMRTKPIIEIGTCWSFLVWKNIQLW